MKTKEIDLNKALLLILGGMLLAFSGCGNATSNGESGTYSGDLSGTIRNVTFRIDSSYVTTNNGSWQIYLWDSNADETTTKDNPSYPYVYFALGDTKGVGTYQVNADGSAGMWVNGMIDWGTGTFFDSGSVTIKTITSTEITGTFNNIETVEKTSRLNGSFIAKIQ